jgi:hypothetical protein
MNLDLQVKIRDCWVLVGPYYPPCTLTAAAATGTFEGSVGDPTSCMFTGSGDRRSFFPAYKGLS